MRWKRCVARVIRGLFPWVASAPTEVMSLTEFNRQELWRWCMPGEFSFGASGLDGTLQPAPVQFRVDDPDGSVAARTHRIRVEIALLRKEMGCPPIYWKKLRA